VDTYLNIEENNPRTDFAFEAGYWKLYCFYLLDDKDLGEFASNFLEKYGEAHAGHEFTNLARLIRADFHFNKQNYPEAATSYVALQVDKLPEKLRPNTQFNRAWSLAEAGRHVDAAVAFTQFITANPGHEFTAKAIARRGLAYRESKDLPNAMNDFQKVVKEHPNSDATELAYLQMGLIAAEQRNHKASIDSFQLMLKKFPNSPAAAQAWFAIGRGHFALEQWAEAVSALEKAINRDAKTYLDQGHQLIVQAQYIRQDVPALSKAVDTYRRANNQASIPANVLSWLGLKLYDQKSYASAANYLSLAATPDTPENTDPRVWSYLAMALLETENFESSLKASDHFLRATPQEGPARARGLLTKGRSLLGLGLNSPKKANLTPSSCCWKVIS
jgi:tetratricopeptide (TPR) repeat protein